jgi:hypothetical protein
LFRVKCWGYLRERGNPKLNLGSGAFEAGHKSTEMELELERPTKEKV